MEFFYNTFFYHKKAFNKAFNNPPRTPTFVSTNAHGSPAWMLPHNLAQKPTGLFRSLLSRKRTCKNTLMKFRQALNFNFITSAYYRASQGD